MADHPCPSVPSPPVPCSVFEVVDVTNEETYYTMGIWRTFEAAMHALDGCGDDAPGEDFDEDSRVIEVREREIGALDWSGVGRVVATVQWVKNCDYEDPNYNQWQRVKTPNTEDQRTGA